MSQENNRQSKTQPDSQILSQASGKDKGPPAVEELKMQLEAERKEKEAERQRAERESQRAEKAEKRLKKIFKRGFRIEDLGLKGVFFSFLKVLKTRIQQLISINFSHFPSWLWFGLKKGRILAYLTTFLLILAIFLPSAFLIGQLSKLITQQQSQKQQSQQQTSQHFSTGTLNLADTSINLSASAAPLTFTHTHTADTKEDFEGSGVNIHKGFGYLGRYDKIGNGFEIDPTRPEESGIVGLWHMNYDWQDSKGTNHGTGYGGVGFTTSARLGSHAGSFDGVNDTISIPAVLNSYPFTVELWATHNLDWNPAGEGTMDELVNMSIGGQRVSLGVVDAWNANGELTLMYGGASHWTAPKPSAVGPGDWNHVVWLVYGNNDPNHKIYINGVSQPMTNHGGAHGGTAGWNIGSNSEGFEMWVGKIDEVAIYNRILSEEEIRQHYEQGSPKDASLYRSPRFDLGAKTKLSSADLIRNAPAGTDMKVYLRSGNTLGVDTDNITEGVLRDTSKAEFDGGTGSGWGATKKGELIASDGLTEPGTGLYFPYKRPITITNNSTSTLNDYQILVPLNTQEIISQGKMTADGRDIRFTDSDGQTLISYWIESGINTISTKIWVKVPQIPASSTKTIYMYYGNSEATPKSDATATFEFFDDFSGDLSKWTTNGVSITSGYANIATTGTGWVNYMYSNMNFDRTNYGFVLGLDVRVLGATASNHETFIGFGSAASGIDRPREAAYYNAIDMRYADAANWALWTTDLPGTAVFRRYTVRIDKASGGQLSADFTATTYTLTGADNNMRIKVNPYLGGAYVDNVRVRKYVSPDPIVSIDNEICPSVSTYYSFPVNLDLSYDFDAIALQTDIPSETAFSLSVQVRSASTEAGLSTAAWTSPQSLTETGNNKINLISINNQSCEGGVTSCAQKNQFWQYRINGTTDGVNTWIVRDVFLIPQPSGYSRLKRIDNNSSEVQNVGDNRYFQYLVFGASNGSAVWELDKIDLISRFSAFDLSKRYQIAEVSLTDSDNLFYRIHYSLENNPNYLSVTAWQDVGDKTAANTLAHTFPAIGQALRWIRFNQLAITGSPPTSPVALAFLAKEANVYTIKKGDGTSLTRKEPGTTSAYYELLLPSAAIGKTSEIQTYQICAGNLGDLRNLTIKALHHPEGTDGYKCASLSWTGSLTDEAEWIDAIEGPGERATITPNTPGYGTNVLLPKNTGCKNFYLRTKVPLTDVAEGPKKIRFYFEGEVL